MVWLPRTGHVHLLSLKLPLLLAFPELFSRKIKGWEDIKDPGCFLRKACIGCILGSSSGAGSFVWDYDWSCRSYLHAPFPHGDRLLMWPVF